MSYDYIAVYMSPELKEQLYQLARDSRMSVSLLVRGLIENKLNGISFEDQPKDNDYKPLPNHIKYGKPIRLE